MFATSYKKTPADEGRVSAAYSRISSLSDYFPIPSLPNSVCNPVMIELSQIRAILLGLFKGLRQFIFGHPKSVACFGLLAAATVFVWRSGKEDHRDSGTSPQSGREWSHSGVTASK